MDRNKVDYPYVCQAQRHGHHVEDVGISAGMLHFCARFKCVLNLSLWSHYVTYPLDRRLGGASLGTLKKTMISPGIDPPSSVTLTEKSRLIDPMEPEFYLKNI
jgi:hypothetical protein